LNEGEEDSNEMEKSIESDMTEQENEEHRDETHDDVTEAAFKGWWGTCLLSRAP